MGNRRRGRVITIHYDDNDGDHDVDDVALATVSILFLTVPCDAGVAVAAWIPPRTTEKEAKLFT